MTKTWNAELILKDIERINPQFYPKPRVETPSSNPGVKAHWGDREMDYLTRKDFVKLYKRCGSLMHADNPYGKQSNYPAYKAQMAMWRQKIVNLLTVHTVQLVRDRNVYLMHMQEAQDGLVHGYTFTPLD